MPEHHYPLDENGLLMLQLAQSGDSPVHVRLVSRYKPEQSDLADNLLPLLSLHTQEKAYVPVAGKLELPVSPQDDVYAVRLNQQPFADITMRNGAVRSIAERRKLSVFETRLIGRAPTMDVPCSHEGMRDIKTQATDLHSHLSGQLYAQDLIAIGLRHNVLYPTVALDNLGIDYPKTQLASIPRRQFLPLAHLQTSTEPTQSAVPLTALAPEGLQKLSHALSLSPENQNTFSAMETCYYLREPFTKNTALLPDILRKVAQNYKEQGIRYAELSSNAVLDPQWLKAMHDVLPGIEKETGVQLRFLAGLPRNLDENALNERIDQIKRIAHSPYVVGVDILGYEMNKTSHLQEHLEELAQWMHDSHPDMVLRIHAGENSKNPNNVNECLQLAKKYDIRIRVGHAVYGIDDETITLAKALAAKGNIIFEFNPDSNLAGNNIDFAHEIPVLQFLHANIPSVLASDGAGMYLTSAKQTAMAGLFCGVTPEGFAFARQTELAHIAKQECIFAQKQRALPQDFFASLDAPLPKREAAPAAPKANIKKSKSLAALEGKCPVFIAGAAGSSWDIVSAQDKQEFITGLKLLLEQLDPDKVQFMTGRTKDRGVGIELGKAVAQYNATHAKQFTATIMEAESDGNGVTPMGFSQKTQLDMPLLFLPHATIGFVKEQHGMALFAGGRSLTREFIQEAADQNIPYGLMQDARGASSEKARVFKDKTFYGAQGMVKYAMQQHPELFTRLLTDAELTQAYAAQSSASGMARG